MEYNCIVLLGPTACGKTGLGVKIADYLNRHGKVSHIISADSRQVYKNLDIGSGKDLVEYTLDKDLKTERKIPYHLIDIVDVSEEYNVYRYQQDFYKVFTKLTQQGILPVIVGGTGMYIDSIVRDYKLGKVSTNVELRKELQGKSIEELCQILKDLKAKNKTELHNSTDLTEHHRVLRAIEIETAILSGFNQNLQNDEIPRPKIEPLILGTTFPRSILRERVTFRLKERLEQGMIEEVKSIHESGIEWERLERLGLEYKFVSLYLQEKISFDELFTQLNTAIHQFVKRQETWFRGMEKKGVFINWLPQDETRFEKAIELIEK